MNAGESAMTAFWTDWRKRTYARAALAALLLSVVLSPFAPTLTSRSSEGLGGDFAAFYGAGVLANQGDYDNLYSETLQAEAQRDSTRVAPGKFLYFSYPPVVAWGYGFLARVSYVPALTLHLLFMLGSLVAAVALGRSLLPKIDEHPQWTFLVALSFWPMRQVVAGGSNTAFTLLLLVVVWRLLESDRELAAGVVASLLLFKPTFGLPVLAVLVVSRRWRAVTGGAGGAAVFYGANAVLAGWGWVVPWWSQAEAFGRKDALINGPNASSILGFAQNISDVQWAWYTVLAGLFLIAVWLGTAWVWSNKSTDLATLMAVLTVASIWGSAHAMSHETAVLMLPVAVLVQRASKGVAPWLIGLSVVSWLGLAAVSLGWAPMFFVSLVIGAAVLHELPGWIEKSEKPVADLVAHG